MTFGNMATELNLRIDQAGAPDFQPPEVDIYLNWGYRAWYKQWRPMFNRDQQATERMTHLLRPFSFNAVNQITIYTPGQAGADIQDYRDLARMKGVFNIKNCAGVTNQKELNIVPTPLSSVDTNNQDPFNKPSDNYPKYKKSNNGTYRTINILSTNTPVSVSGEYFKIGQIIDSANNPTTVFEAPDFVAEEIIEWAKKLMKTDVDDYMALKAADAEIVEP